MLRIVKNSLKVDFVPIPPFLPPSMVLKPPFGGNNRFDGFKAPHFGGWGVESKEWAEWLFQ